MKPCPRSRPAASRADAARARLLAAGLECFASHGIDGVSIREIARKARQNSAAITYYFESKEGLYRAVLDSVLRFVRAHSEAVAADYTRHRDAGTLDPATAEALLKRLQRDMFLGVFGGTEALKFALLIAREQVQPTEAFAVLYTSGLERIHRMLTHLLAIVVGESPENPRSILRAHTLFGELQIFVMARALILRRLRWKGYEDPHAAEILSVLEENLDLLLAGLRTRAAAAPATTNIRSKRIP